MKPKPGDELRRQGLNARRSMSSAERHVASRRIASRVIRAHEFVAADYVACYLPMADEVDPGRIIARAWRSGKQVFVPVVTSGREMFFTRLDPDSRLSKNELGIWEPETTEVVAPHDLDLVMTPLVAFDACANRIGMGGGYYDRQFDFLRRRRRWRRPKLLGIAFATQQVPAIAPNPWDVRLYGVITESATLYAKAPAPQNQ